MKNQFFSHPFLSFSQYLPEHLMVFQGSPAQTDQVGLAGGQELFRLFSGGNASRKEHRDPGRFFGCPGQFRKIPGFRMAGTEKMHRPPES